VRPCSFLDFNENYLIILLAFMIVEKIFPNVVGEKSTLLSRLLVEAKERGIKEAHINAIVSLVPPMLIGATSFLDKMTNIWRYEFGVPYDIGKNLVLGTHMWVPVHCLVNALWCAYSRLPQDQCVAYFKRLADPHKHQATLVEMIPTYKVDSAIPVQFEVQGQGIGNKTIDWVIGPHNGRTVLLDVKRRTTDFIKQAERIGGDSVATEPNHDPALLFRSVEKKFKPGDPDLQLQGVWVITDIKQNEQKLSAAFAELDKSKIHFAILGDWKPDAYVLVRRSEDEQYLRELFYAEKSARFTFTQDED
jgi:hypothetical protein